MRMLHPLGGHRLKKNSRRKSPLRNGTVSHEGRTRAGRLLDTRQHRLQRQLSAPHLSLCPIHSKVKRECEVRQRNCPVMQSVERLFPAWVEAEIWPLTHAVQEMLHKLGLAQLFVTVAVGPQEVAPLFLDDVFQARNLSLGDD